MVAAAQDRNSRLACGSIEHSKSRLYPDGRIDGTWELTADRGVEFCSPSQCLEPQRPCAGRLPFRVRTSENVVTGNMLA
jgi:hypothetical protein